MTQQQNNSGGSLFIGSFLICIGALWALSTNTPFSFDPGLILRSWPLIIVIIGLFFVISSELLKNIFTVILGIFVALFVFSFFQSSFNIPNSNQVVFLGNNNSRQLNTSLISLPLEPGIQKASLSIKAGASQLGVKSGAKNLIEGEGVSTLSTWDITKSTSDGLTTANIAQKNQRMICVFCNHRNSLQVGLNSNIIWEISVDAGASDTKFDFKDLNIKKFNANIGASKAVLIFGDKQDQVDVDINAGASNVNIEVPKSLGVSIKTNGIQSSTLDGLLKVGENEFKSDGYDNAPKKITIQVNGLTSLNISRI